MKIADMKKGYAAMNGGVWVKDIPAPLFEGISLKVTRLFTPAYNELHDKLIEDGTDLSEEANERRISNECLAQTVLLDWKGVDDAFSIDTVRDLLGDPELGPAFRSAVLWCAQNIGDTVKKQLEGDTANL